MSHERLLMLCGPSILFYAEFTSMILEMSRVGQKCIFDGFPNSWVVKMNNDVW